MSTTLPWMARAAERVQNYPRVRVVVEQVVHRLVEAVKPSCIILYGSYVHGRPTSDSDLDFLVVSDSQEPGYAQTRKAREAIGAVDMPVDVFVLSRQEFEETRGVIGGLAYVPAKYGVVVYEKP